MAGDGAGAEMAARRLQVLADHLCSAVSFESRILGTAECASQGKLRHAFDPEVMAVYIGGSYRAQKEQIYSFFRTHPELYTPVEISKDDHRRLVMKQIRALVLDLGLRPLQYLMSDPGRYFAMMDAIGAMDLSLAIKTGVNFSLWGGSVMNLGTQKHHDKYMSAIEKLEAPGCFAMTELDHGSNVQGVQTTARYDRGMREFIIDTPNEGATKWWIGNAALHGQFATVFARLMLLPKAGAVEEEDLGVHAFIVPIRKADGTVLPGVEIRDCGHKIGLNGIDNGALRFHNVRVPRDNLLNRFGDVAPDGTYSSKLPSPAKRFAATLGELVGGRVGLASGSAAVLKAATTIAVRYSLLRHQFGPPNQPEVAILDYQSQQEKLMPMLATAYAFHWASGYLVQLYSQMKQTHDETLMADVHAMSAGLKAHITAYTAKAVSVCRECCGGHGYASVNRFGALRNDHDIFLTFEGDNTVLLQQLAADLLKHYKEKFSAGPLTVTWQYLRDKMGTFVSQTNPVTTHREGQDHLRDPAFQLAAFQYRTARLLHTAALRLRSNAGKLGGFGAWNRCLNHLLTLANAHIETVILTKFISAVQKCQDRSCRIALKTMCDLYALDRICTHIGSFRNEDYVAPNKAKAIQRMREKLCYEARQVAGPLVDAFDIPDHMLRAPIGLRSQQYEAYNLHVGWAPPAGTSVAASIAMDDHEDKGMLEVMPTRAAV